MGTPKSIAETSRETFNMLTVDQVSRAQYLCLKAIWYGGQAGATCDEIEERTELKHQTASATLRGLEKKNKVHRPGTKRKTRSGCPAFVYHLGPMPPADPQGKLF